jgi:hypothetical protein
MAVHRADLPDHTLHIGRLRKSDGHGGEPQPTAYSSVGCLQPNGSQRAIRAALPLAAVRALAGTGASPCIRAGANLRRSLRIAPVGAKALRAPYVRRGLARGRQ